MTSESTPSPLHMIDLIRKKRDGLALDPREIAFLACRRSLSAPSLPSSSPPGSWPAWIARPLARRNPRPHPRHARLRRKILSRPARQSRRRQALHRRRRRQDQLPRRAHRSGLRTRRPHDQRAAPSATPAAHWTSWNPSPAIRTALTLAEFEIRPYALRRSIVSQTPALVPADRVLYALRDLTGTVENPGLICASILSKKLAAGLNALVLDVKTGSGAFLRKPEDAEYLAALMVATAEAAGTRTVALLTDMGQPLGSAAGNFIELVESVELLRGQRPPQSEDLRELSLILAGWMIHLGGKAETPEPATASPKPPSRMAPPSRSSSK